MKKIKTAESVAKKQRKNQIVMGIILVSLLILSTAGFSIQSSKSEDKNYVDEGGYRFYRQNGRWFVNIEQETFNFNYLPSEVENVSVIGEFNLENYVGNPLYFVGESEGIYEVLSSLGRYASRYQGACLENSTCENDLPSKTCSDNLIIFKEGISGVVSEGNCVYIDKNSALLSSDAFLYEVLKIK